MARRASEETGRITFDDGVTMIAPKYCVFRLWQEHNSLRDTM